MDSNSYYCSICGARIKRKQQQTVVAQRTNIICESVCENDHICLSCCRLAVQNFAESNASVALQMEVYEDNEQSLNGDCSLNGDRNVCLMCDTSLSTRQSLPIVNPEATDLDHLMVKLISEAIPPQTKISSGDRVCSKCWFIIRRYAKFLQQINKLKLNEIEDENQSVEIKLDPESDQDDSDCLMAITEESHSEETEIQNKVKQREEMESEGPDNQDYSSTDDMNDNSNDPDFSIKSPKQPLIRQKKHQNNRDPSEDILLPNYSRCSCTTRHCVFPGCNNPERLSISVEIRKKVLGDYKLYIPHFTRVCQQHLQSNDWHDLCTSLSSSNTQYKFNTKQIEDMFSMIQIKKESTDLDFNNILNFDDYFIEHLLGVKREILMSILMREPKIKKMCNGLNGLLGLFLKHENGGSKDRIKTLLNIPRTTLRKGMDDVKKILSTSPVTKELGIEYLLDVT